MYLTSISESERLRDSGIKFPATYTPYTYGARILRANVREYPLFTRKTAAICRLINSELNTGIICKFIPAFHATDRTLENEEF